jgi:hypothetical protein
MILLGIQLGFGIMLSIALLLIAVALIRLTVRGGVAATAETASALAREAAEAATMARSYRSLIVLVGIVALCVAAALGV